MVLGMVSRTQVCSTFRQYGATCILASYSIASTFYTKIPIIAFFRDYCSHYEIETTEIKLCQYFCKHFITRHYNLPQRLAAWVELTKLNKYEIAYDNHFHEENRLRKISGLKLMKEIHDGSYRSSFKTSSCAFDLSLIENVLSDTEMVYNHLDAEESLLIVAFDGEEGGRHIAVVGYDNNGLYMVETRPGRNGIIGISNLQSLANPGDALLTIKKRQE